LLFAGAQFSGSHIDHYKTRLTAAFERRFERLGGRSPKPVEPIAEDATEAPDLSN
jgi:hypothetical protein